MLDKFEEKRADIYEVIIGHKQTRENEGKINMLKAFLTYGSKPGPDGSRNTFHDKVEAIVMQNQEYQHDMLKNVWPPDIGQDPRKAPNPFKEKKNFQSSVLAKSVEPGAAAMAEDPA